MMFTEHVATACGILALHTGRVRARLDRLLNSVTQMCCTADGGAAVSKNADCAAVLLLHVLFCLTFFGWRLAVQAGCAAVHALSGA